jgi:Flp pilus assembly protein TadB
MIPAKWYIAIMIAAGAAVFLVGLAQANLTYVIESFLLLGLGGFVYFAIHARSR